MKNMVLKSIFLSFLVACSKDNIKITYDDSGRTTAIKNSEQNKNVLYDKDSGNSYIWLILNQETKNNIDITDINFYSKIGSKPVSIYLKDNTTYKIDPLMGNSILISGKKISFLNLNYISQNKNIEKSIAELLIKKDFINLDTVILEQGKTTENKPILMEFSKIEIDNSNTDTDKIIFKLNNSDEYRIEFKKSDLGDNTKFNLEVKLIRKLDNKDTNITTNIMVYDKSFETNWKTNISLYNFGNSETIFYLNNVENISENTTSKVIKYSDEYLYSIYSVDRLTSTLEEKDLIFRIKNNTNTRYDLIKNDIAKNNLKSYDKPLTIIKIMEILK
jgi:hypothetical protein